ncbi:MAG TPA: hypothetical protein DEA82_08270 [Flavobacteriaceae bacterium]|nr:hypothetical protein [Flavobacteriaceae bacterium]HBR54172.1 hypothetical protein [Flavobacteriaceae bacterium]
MNAPRLLLFLVLLTYGPLKAQAPFFFDELRHYRLDRAEQIINTLPENVRSQATWRVDFLKEFKIESDQFQSLKSLNKPDDNGLGDYLYHLNWGDYYFYITLDQNIKAMAEYQKAMAIAYNKNDTMLIGEVLKRILTLHRVHYLYNNKTYKPYLKDFRANIYDQLEEAYYHYFNLILNFKNYNTEAWSEESYTFLKNYFKTHQNPYLQGISETVFASYFEEIDQRDSIWHYALSARDQLNSIPYGYKGTRLNQIYSFMSRIALQEKNFSAASVYTDSATVTYYNSIDLKFKSLGHYQKSVIDSAAGNYLQAYDESMNFRVSMAAIERAAQNNLFNELEVKYQTAEKEKQLLLSEQEKKKTQNIAIGLGGSVIAVVIIGILFIKNTKRKQRIAEQQRELEIQKTEKILKEQELTTIDAMIEGQEKERKRLASDLHDSVGATLAAAKLQFHHLSKNREQGEFTDALFSKIGKLLEDAYAEIRGMAHVKNNGVIAKNGLLPAVHKLANSASGANGLTITVEDYGLEERLDNTLEISVFRIIQELVTNIIKHSQATEASISINQYEDSLNIIVEDNGKGFDARHLPQKEGMGLSSIEKRIEHLEGTMEVDTTLGKGTNILIDIPL